MKEQRKWTIDKLKMKHTVVRLHGMVVLHQNRGVMKNTRVTAVWCVSSLFKEKLKLKF